MRLLRRDIFGTLLARVIDLFENSLKCFLQDLLRSLRKDGVKKPAALLITATNKSRRVQARKYIEGCTFAKILHRGFFGVSILSSEVPRLLHDQHAMPPSQATCCPLAQGLFGPFTKAAPLELCARPIRSPLWSRATGLQHGTAARQRPCWCPAARLRHLLWGFQKLEHLSPSIALDGSEARWPRGGAATFSLESARLSPKDQFIPQRPRFGNSLRTHLCCSSCTKLCGLIGLRLQRRPGPNPR
mmetsp:Transcript_173739/g.556821  ORF Transcript_173739/g.556821 Transcript_173739/m.556821 type:complete len:244 (-) Transcript_173739:986-1717(-)